MKLHPMSSYSPILTPEARRSAVQPCWARPALEEADACWISPAAAKLQSKLPLLSSHFSGQLCPLLCVGRCSGTGGGRWGVCGGGAVGCRKRRFQMAFEKPDYIGRAAMNKPGLHEFGPKWPCCAAVIQRHMKQGTCWGWRMGRLVRSHVAKVCTHCRYRRQHESPNLLSCHFSKCLIMRLGGQEKRTHLFFSPSPEPPKTLILE